MPGATYRVRKTPAYTKSFSLTGFASSRPNWIKTSSSTAPAAIPGTAKRRLKNYGSARYFEHLGMHMVFDLVSIEVRIVAR